MGLGCVNSQLGYRPPFFGINTVNPLFLVVEDICIYGFQNQGMLSIIEAVSYTIKKKKKEKCEGDTFTLD